MRFQYFRRGFLADATNILNVSRPRKSRKCQRNRIRFMCGFLIGVFCGLYLQLNENVSNNASSIDCQSAFKYDRKDKKFVLIGVITAQKYLSTRAIAAYETWVRTIPGKVLFFSSEGAEMIAPAGLPVIGLKGVDDTYPPQKKSFLMIKYIHEYYADEYQWFLRADDDVYIKGDKLELFLRSLNSTKHLYIGQTGIGNGQEYGKINIPDDKPYCMGGPGMIFSEAIMRKFAPHISYCLKNLVTPHEDIEVGRCVTMFTNTSCTQAMQNSVLFHHNYKEPNGSFVKDLQEINLQEVITLHPLKNHSYQYHIHAHFNKLASQQLRHRTVSLQEEINTLDDIILEKYPGVSTTYLDVNSSLTNVMPKTRESIIPWEFLKSSLHQTHKRANPRYEIETGLKTVLQHTTIAIKRHLKTDLRKRRWKYSEFLHAYMLMDPVHGVNYIFNTLISYRIKGIKHRKRYQFYMHQHVGKIEFKEDIYTENVSQIKQPKERRHSLFNESHFSSDLNHNLLNRILDFPYQYHVEQHSQNESHMSHNVEILHFIVALSGRFERFVLFMDNFESAVLQQEEKAVLSVMLFKQGTGTRSSEMQLLIQQKQIQYPQHKLELVLLDGTFSRGLGLEKGSRLHSLDALLVFIDVDVILHPDIIARIKLNTIKGKQTYFPIMFSQFNQSMRSHEGPESNPFNYSDTVGYWRDISYGMVAMYNSDFQAVGGFNTSIQGWGAEDVDLFERFLNDKIIPFRAPDLGLIHLFHSKYCDTSLADDQYKMCLGSKGETFAAVTTLSELVYNNDNILHRLENSKEQN